MWLAQMLLAPSAPEGTLSLEESLLVVDEQLHKSADLEDRLKGLLDDQNNVRFHWADEEQPHFHCYSIRNTGSIRGSD
jgi:hypothetical protein